MCWPLLFALILWGCSKGPETDLPSIAAARSLAAEWAMVNDQATKGNLTRVYTETMRKDVREQLQSAQRALTQPQSDYGREISQLLKEPDDASPQALHARSTKLRQIEDSLESA